MRAAPVQRTILSTGRIMLPPLTLCAYMKKGPNLRWSLIQCSGGDEGDRTPDLLTASQALSQLSYAPVRRSTIRELGRRCKDIFGKTFRGCGRRSPAGSRRRRPAPAGPMRARVQGVLAPRCPTKPAGRAPRAAALPPSFPAPLGHLEFRRPPLFALGVRSAMRRAAIPPTTVPLLGPITLSPTRPFQYHAGLRG